jgi:hypothetical protein
MKRFVLSTLFLLVPAAAAAEPPVGLTEAQLLQCAGVPTAQMQSGGAKVWQYSVSRVGGDFSMLRTDACDAIVTFKNGRVANVTFRKSGGLIAREIVCAGIFSGCR